MRSKDKASLPYCQAIERVIRIIHHRESLYLLPGGSTAKTEKEITSSRGGFLGLDNIGPFNRSTLPPTIQGYLDQSDGTSWMGMYCLNMLRIALELSASDKSYQEMAGKFFQHFLLIG